LPAAPFAARIEMQYTQPRCRHPWSWPVRAGT
jgi:hypothetical protein